MIIKKQFIALLSNERVDHHKKKHWEVRQNEKTSHQQSIYKPKLCVCDVRFLLMTNHFMKIEISNFIQLRSISMVLPHHKNKFRTVVQL